MVKDKAILFCPLFSSEVSQSPKFFESLHNFLISVCTVPNSVLSLEVEGVCLEGSLAVQAVKVEPGESRGLGFNLCVVPSYVVCPWISEVVESCGVSSWR